MLADLRAGDTVCELDGARIDSAIRRWRDGSKSGPFGEKIVPLAFVVNMVAESSAARADRHIDCPAGTV